MSCLHRTLQLQNEKPPDLYHKNPQGPPSPGLLNPRAKHTSPIRNHLTVNSVDASERHNGALFPEIHDLGPLTVAGTWLYLSVSFS
ncbi:hypothetical protein HPP92_025900 [Vanilla planifolia]|uniref:Uncharacterized protein n=1 Tax=Vanilla planifolia TaxID=51239 RepID=A0A835PFA2_VANPL|nr:hypothetical protein HPP92_025900 [Vanilla planifolia]